jgi:hypothetical protein
MVAKAKKKSLRMSSEQIKADVTCSRIGTDLLRAATSRSRCFEELYLQLGRPQNRTITHSGEAPCIGRMMWKCGCGLNYIDLQGFGETKEPIILQMTRCDAHSCEDEQEDAIR